jgi:hypothetical protein
MTRSHDPIKAALGELTFSALKHAVSELPGVAGDPAWEPLEDCVIEVMDITDTEALVSIAGNGKRQWYSIKIQTHRKV